MLFTLNGSGTGSAVDRKSRKISHKFLTVLLSLGLFAISGVACDSLRMRNMQKQYAALNATPERCGVYASEAEHGDRRSADRARAA
jgi:hypothetical protein